MHERSGINEIDEEGTLLKGISFNVRAALTVVATDAYTASLGFFRRELQQKAQPCVALGIADCTKHRSPGMFFLRP